MQVNARGFPGGSVDKESICNEGDLGSIPGLGRSPGGGHYNLLQFSCLENPHGQRSFEGYRPWGHKQSNTQMSFQHVINIKVNTEVSNRLCHTLRSVLSLLTHVSPALSVLGSDWPRCAQRSQGAEAPSVDSTARQWPSRAAHAFRLLL